MPCGESRCPDCFGTATTVECAAAISTSTDVAARGCSSAAVEVDIAAVEGGQASCIGHRSLGQLCNLVAGLPKRIAPGAGTARPASATLAEVVLAERGPALGLVALGQALREDESSGRTRAAVSGTVHDSLHGNCDRLASSRGRGLEGFRFVNIHGVNRLRIRGKVDRKEGGVERVKNMVK